MAEQRCGDLLTMALRAGLTFIAGLHFLLYFVAGHNPL
jgi:hypothetical protein